MHHFCPLPCRLAAEQRISDLQTLVDETFQQFALDDSEDDFDESTSPAVESTSFQYALGSHPLLHLPIEHKVPLKTYLSSPLITIIKSCIKMDMYHSVCIFNH